MKIDRVTVTLKAVELAIMKNKHWDRNDILLHIKQLIAWQGLTQKEKNKIYSTL